MQIDAAVSETQVLECLKYSAFKSFNMMQWNHSQICKYTIFQKLFAFVFLTYAWTTLPLEVLDRKQHSTVNYLIVENPLFNDFFMFSNPPPIMGKASPCSLSFPIAQFIVIYTVPIAVHWNNVDKSNGFLTINKILRNNTFFVGRVTFALNKYVTVK